MAVPIPQVLAATALGGAVLYFGYRAISSMGATTPGKDKTDPKPAGATIDISTVAGVQKALITLGYSVGPDGADGKNGTNTGKAINAFRAAQTPPLPASTAIDNPLRTALAVALRAKGYAVTGESGPVLAPVATSKTSSDDAKGAKTATAKELYAKADKLEAESDALNDQADEWEATADDPDTSAFTETALRVKIKANRDLADKKMGEADGYRGAAKLAEAAAASTKGYASTAGVGALPPWLGGGVGAMRSVMRSVPAPHTSAYSRAIRASYDFGRSSGRASFVEGRGDVDYFDDAFPAFVAFAADGVPMADIKASHEAGFADGYAEARAVAMRSAAVKSNLPPYLRGAH